jgi:conjugative transfer region protein (TIGR03750 family)
MADPMAERLNTEPAVFRGYGDSELVAAMAVAAGAWFPVGLFGGLAAGRLGLGIGLAMAATFGSVVLGAGAFQTWKRGRPDYWLGQAFHRRLADGGVVASPLLRHRGVLSLGRDRYDHPARIRRRPPRRRRR